MKVQCFTKPPKFRLRFIMMILGIIVQGFGLSVLVRLNLGTDPCTSLTQGVINHIPISFGTAQLMCHLVLFVFVIRFDTSKISFGTIGNMVFMGYIADFFGWIWDRSLPEGFFQVTQVRMGALIPTLAVFILGAAFYMSAGLGTSPYDALPFIIADRNPRFSFRLVRMGWDICIMIAGAALGGDVGVITIAAAFFLGPVIAWVGKKVEAYAGFYARTQKHVPTQIHNE